MSLCNKNAKENFETKDESDCKWAENWLKLKKLFIFTLVAAA